MDLEVTIIVPDRVFWKDNAKEVILPLKDHIPILTGLDIGCLKLQFNFKKHS